MYLIILFPIAFVTFFIFVGIFKIRKNYFLKNYFISFNVITLIWLLTNFFCLYTGVGFLWFKLAYATGALVLCTTFLLILSFSKQAKLSNFTLLKIYLIGGSFFTLSLFDNIFFKGKSETYTDLFLVYFISLIGLLLFSLYKIYIVSKNFQGIKKLQARYIFLGLFTFIFVSSLMSFWSPLLFDFPELGRYDFFGQLFFIGFTGYAIIQYKLLDIDLVWRYTSSYLLYFFLGSSLFVSILFSVRDWFYSILVVCVSFVAFLPFLHKLILKFANNILLKKYNRVWDDLNKQGYEDEVFGTTKKLISKRLNNILRQLKLANGSFFIFKEQSDNYILFEHQGNQGSKNMRINSSNKIIEYLKFTKQPLMKDLIVNDDKTDILSTMDELNAEIAFPVFLSFKLIGILFLGPKITNNIFNPTDINAIVGIIKRTEPKLKQTLYLEQQEQLMEASKKMSEIKELNKLAKYIVHTFMRSLNSVNASIYIYNEKESNYTKAYEKGLLQNNKDIAFKHDDHFIKYLTQRGSPLLYNDIHRWAEETRSEELKNVAKKSADIHAQITIPMIYEKLLGFVVLGEKRVFKTYSYEEINTCNILASAASTNIHNIILAEEAMRDPLTNLYNRKHFSALVKESILKSIKIQKPLSFIIIDLDHFKQYNDDFGHQYGDTILEKFSNYIVRSIRPADIAVRYGGEEFVLILPNTNSEGAQVFCNRLQASLKDEPVISDITMSIGIGSFIPEKREEDEIYPLDIDRMKNQLIKVADAAVYKAKKNGRDQIYVGEELLERSILTKKNEYKIKIAIIIPDDITARKTSHTLQLLGCDTHVFNTGRDGLRFMDQSSPDIVLMSLDLPDVDGVEIIRQMAIKYITTIKAILATTNKAHLREEMLELGVQGFFLEPLKPQDIEAWIKYIKEMI
ncbi:diguanylate cyclase [bacterium]